MCVCVCVYVCISLPYAINFMTQVSKLRQSCCVDSRKARTLNLYI